ncbi:hypothetical protein ACQY0O_008234 [Thecaphora frezii]
MVGSWAASRAGEALRSIAMPAASGSIASSAATLVAALRRPAVGALLPAGLAGAKAQGTGPTRPVATSAAAFDVAPRSYDARRVRRVASRPGYAQDTARIVLLSGLPTSALPNDIRGLAPNAKIANHVSRIEFLRTHFFEPSGKALVHFSTENHARGFEQACSKRILGGSVLDARCFTPKEAEDFHTAYYRRHPRFMQLPLDLVNHESGKLVLLRGLPLLTTEEKMAIKLGRTYDLANTTHFRATKRSNAGISHARGPDFNISHSLHLGPVLRLLNLNPDASTVSFIVRLKTTHEAMRLARKWHNNFFAPQRFNIEATGGRFCVQAHVVY